MNADDEDPQRESFHDPGAVDIFRLTGWAKFDETPRSVRGDPEALKSFIGCFRLDVFDGETFVSSETDIVFSDPDETPIVTAVKRFGRKYAVTLVLESGEGAPRYTGIKGKELYILTEDEFPKVQMLSKGERAAAGQ